MTIIHEQLYDGGWLVKIEHDGKIYTGTGWTYDGAVQNAKYAAGIIVRRKIVRKPSA